jgi:hypothetical protein
MAEGDYVNLSIPGSGGRHVAIRRPYCTDCAGRRAEQSQKAIYFIVAVLVVFAILSLVRFL